MDSVVFAVLAIALFIIGVAGLIGVGLFFAAAAIRYEVLPRMWPVFARAFVGARDWFAPEPSLPTRRL